MWPVAIFFGLPLLILLLLFQKPTERLDQIGTRQEIALRTQPDWEALKTIPVREVVDFAALADTINLLFDDKRDEATAAIDARAAELRDLLWLTVLARNMGYVRDGTDHGLHTYFFLPYGALAPQVKGAIERTGQVERARLFSEAMALCGTPYPTDNMVRAKLFAWSQPSESLDDVTSVSADLNGFDRRLFALSAEFGTRDAMWSAIEDVVARNPTLEAWAREQREKLSDDDRLAHLTSGLVFNESVNEAAMLASWPRPYQILFLLNYFNAEMLNGSVHQFFYNSSGDFAPQVAVALREIALPKHAAAVERGIAQFRSPYPVDTETRRRLYFNAEMTRPFDQVLYDLTGDVDDGAIPEAMVALAKREGILPR